ncbi:prolipoprotein diacylglyceryl transferase [Natranaerobius thermophilus]|uniref:Phosphatidylglycerol--prolipoprotein diacylglyceryl transferase n=1 Tax=Natranaerobius thermophilus (strain ATCC BAA-1301 / DSM 18059 / JW/NM-WN-LF) TaxID=457570 RepID=B2A0J7_NATTJ|nr:prolipoprotein diacylglyceryl transferase [Natranaerobius thermophilus]ACB84558.1 prolipoprotein diacylglyceryl transferase [Natranaerobius thermophilus JW/NM-WN-LF]
MKVLFWIFDIPVHFFGVTIAAGVLAGIWLIYREASNSNEFNQNTILDMAIYMFLFVIVGARVGYILFYNPAHYLQDPLQIFMIHQGGLSVHGGIVGGLLFGIWYVKKYKLDFWKLADLFAPALILGQAIGRIGCDVFGKPMETHRFWGVVYEGVLVHPAQIYEVILNFVVFFILWEKRKVKNYHGQIFLWYIILFSVNRGIVEIFRVNPTIVGELSVSHLLSLIFIIAALIISYFRKQEGALLDVSNNQFGIKKILNLIIVVILSLISVFIYYSVWGGWVA